MQKMYQTWTNQVRNILAAPEARCGEALVRALPDGAPAYYRRESQGAWEETSEGSTSEGTWTVGGLANAVRCPGPDAGISFDGAVRAAEAARAALARAWGDDETELFPAAASGTAGEDEGAGGGDADEDEMDALLRNLPGGVGA